jgi:hypothetical protein
MNEVKETLRRGLAGFAPSPDALERTHARVLRRRRIRRVMAAALALTVSAAAGVGLWAGFARVHPRVPTDGARRVSVTSVSVRYPSYVVTGAGFVWLPYNDGSLQRIDPGTLKHVTPRLLCSVSPPAFGSDSMWVYGDNDNGCLAGSTSEFRVRRVDPSTGAVLGEVPVSVPSSLPNSQGTVVVGAGAVWTLNWSEIGTGDNYQGAPGLVSRIDPARSRVTGRVRIPKDGAELEVGLGKVWLLNVEGARRGIVYQLDPSTLRMEPGIHVGRQISGFALGFNSAWVTNRVDGTLSRIDPNTGRVESRIRVATGAARVVVGDGLVWVTNDDGDLWWIDPATDRLAGGPIEFKGTFTGITVGQGAAWVTTMGSAGGWGRLYRIVPGG